MIRAYYLRVLATTTNVITRQVPTIPAAQPLRYPSPRTPDSGTALPLRFADYLVSGGQPLGALLAVKASGAIVDGEARTNTLPPAVFLGGRPQ